MDREFYQKLSYAKEIRQIQQEDSEHGVSSLSDARAAKIMDRVKKQTAKDRLDAGPELCQIVDTLVAEGVPVMIDRTNKHGLHLKSRGLRYPLDGMYDGNMKKQPWTTETLRLAIRDRRGQ